MDKDKRPSMTEFDYFSDAAKPSSPEEVAARFLPIAMEEEMLAYHRRRWRAIFAIITASLVIAVSAWYLWGYRDLIAYSFARSQPPYLLGNVADLNPNDIPHNTYVELSGVTEPRGLTQRISLGLWPQRVERWYFRLLGSQGVFIEVPPEGDRFAFGTKVTVRGRVIDPSRSRFYSRFAREYGFRFQARSQNVARILQVGRVPGEGRLQFVVVAGFVLLVGLFDLFTLWRFLRYSRHRAGLMR